MALPNFNEVARMSTEPNDLKQFVESHSNNVSLFPWEVGKRLDAISNAYGKNGSGQFSQFMENLSDNIGLAKTSGYNYLDRYRQSVCTAADALFSQAPGKVKSRIADEFHSQFGSEIRKSPDKGDRRQ